MSTQAAKVHAIGREVLSDHVYEEIFASLVDGRLEAGAGLSIDGLARELDVSPTPVREALARLEATGMVQRAALKGYRVAPMLSAGELGELMDARLVIEPVSAQRACERVTPELVMGLEEAIADLREAPRGASFAEFRSSWEADERFHRLIAESGANQFILLAYHALGGLIQRFRFVGGLGVTDADLVVEEHTAILEAIRAGDPAKAGDAMIAHVSAVTDRALKKKADDLSPELAAAL